MTKPIVRHHGSSPSLPETPGRLTPKTRTASRQRSLCGAHSICSFGKGTAENQDTFVTKANDKGTKLLAGVFDGHGEMGARVSQFACDSLCQSFGKHKEAQSNPKGALEAAYQSVQHRIEKDHSRTASESGTTAVLAYKHHDRLFVANVGDSKAVLGRSDGAGLQAVDLSREHKPDLPDERQRLEKLGATVGQMQIPVRSDGGSIRWTKAGPARVMLKEGRGGLAVSRSLGDLSFKPFVSATPEIIERRLDSKDRLVVLGSDGIWDHITSKEAVSIAGHHGNPSDAAKELASIAHRRWNVQTGGRMSDDITAVVVRLAADSRPSSPRQHLRGSFRSSLRRTHSELSFGQGMTVPHASRSLRRT